MTAEVPRVVCPSAKGLTRSARPMPNLIFDRPTAANHDPKEKVGLPTIQQTALVHQQHFVQKEEESATIMATTLTGRTKDKKRGHKSLPDSSGKEKGKKSKRRDRKVAAEEDEERRLTSLLFGGSSSLAVGGASTAIARTDAQDDVGSNGVLDFEIDRTGQGAPALDDLAVNERVDDGGAQAVSARAKTDDVEDDEDRPAWIDEDDARVEVNLLQTDRLRKLRTSRDEVGASALGGTDFSDRLRERYTATMHKTARTDWADVDEEKKEEVASADDALVGPLLRQSSQRLPPNLLDVVRCPDANQSDPSTAVVQAVHFHPGSEPDRPLMLTAGLDKTLRFFQVGVEESVKVHGIHFPKMPIYSAQFVGKSGTVLVTGRRPFFYLYDAVVGKLDQVPRILGRAEKSWEKTVTSPDGRTVAFCGNDGYIVLFDIIEKQAKAEFKLNGSVRAVTFSPDGEHIVASGSDGEVYRWDVRSTKCLERFTNQDGTISSALALSSHHLAVGAESGVVNLYSGGLHQSRSPLKSIMNLHTSADKLQFNGDGQILAMSTRRDKQTMKLLHVPTATVFSNWPTSKTPLGYVWSMDFSPESKFLAIGNDKGKCLLYNLQHYSRSEED